MEKNVLSNKPLYYVARAIQISKAIISILAIIEIIISKQNIKDLDWLRTAGFIVTTLVFFQTSIMAYNDRLYGIHFITQAKETKNTRESLFLLILLIFEVLGSVGGFFFVLKSLTIIQCVFAVISFVVLSSAMGFGFADETYNNEPNRKEVYPKYDKDSNHSKRPGK